MSKIAILQVADTGPLESIVVMLRSAGYECFIPSDKLRTALLAAGCDTVYSPASLQSGMGYEAPFPLHEADPKDMTRPGVLYVDVKGHRNYKPVVAKWPNLEGRVLWYRINGGKPEHVIKTCGCCGGTGMMDVGKKLPCELCGGTGKIDHGNELDPPCPVLTPNQWYRGRQITEEFPDGSTSSYWAESAQVTYESGEQFDLSSDPRYYTCWPPFVRFADYRDRTESGYTDPVCLIHSFAGWGYGRLEEPLRTMGLKIYGRSSPDGLIHHSKIPAMLRTALCMIHLKSSDAPGYAIYEALAAGCPVVCTRRLIWRCRMQDLLIPGETCLVFDRKTHDGLDDDDVKSCTAEVAAHLERLRDPAENRRIGLAGRAKLAEIQWREDRDANGLRYFLTTHFG